MPEPSDAIDAALETLSGLVAGGHPGPVVEVASSVGREDAEAIAREWARRAGPEVPRALFDGDGFVFAGVGAAQFAALSHPPGDAVRRLVEAAPRRRAVVAVDFPSPPAACLGGGTLRLPSAPAWLPLLSWSWRGGQGSLALDLGKDPASRVRAQRFLDRLRAARAASQMTPVAFEEVDVLPDRATHAAAVHEALARMTHGGLEKVVLARRRRLRCRGDAGDLAFRLWQRLVRSGPDEVRYLVGRGDGDLVGVTPELLCRRRGRALSADVLAGTAAPGSRDLLQDPKERREHEAVRTFIVDTLKPIAEEVRAPGTPGLRRLQHVEHLHTPVTATLREAAPVFDRLHPTPAVAGTPREEALGLIGRLEPFDRGLYAGAIGLADSEGEELWVALRCALVRGDEDGGSLELFAGSGIVPGADPEREWLELDRKEGTMRSAIAALQSDAPLTGAFDGA